MDDAPDALCTQESTGNRLPSSSHSSLSFRCCHIFVLRPFLGDSLHRASERDEHNGGAGLVGRKKDGRRAMGDGGNELRGRAGACMCPEGVGGCGLEVKRPKERSVLVIQYVKALGSESERKR